LRPACLLCLQRKLVLRTAQIQRPLHILHRFMVTPCRVNMVHKPNWFSNTKKKARINRCFLMHHVIVHHHRQYHIAAPMAAPSVALLKSEPPERVKSCCRSVHPPPLVLLSFNSTGIELQYCILWRQLQCVWVRVRVRACRLLLYLFYYRGTRPPLTPQHERRPAHAARLHVQRASCYVVTGIRW
jgi:hypothetical protein